MKKYLIAVSIIVLLFTAAYLGDVYAMPGYQNESFYSDQICKEEFHGAPTDYVSYKPDCETALAVVEFDWAFCEKLFPGTGS